VFFFVRCKGGELDKMLDDRKILAIELLVDGELPKTEIAKRVGCSRQAIYEWLEKNEEFKAELDARLHHRKVSVQKRIDSKLDFVVDKLYELAADSSNKRVQAQVLQYLADRSLGKPTSKHEVTAEAKTSNVSEDVLEAEFEEWDVEGE
jgi:predicted DNA-binding protein YlxM (UPF0122 family)